MSSVIEPALPDTSHHEADAHEHPTDKKFIEIAVFLAVITGLETWTYWWPESWHTFSLIVLIACMVLKFVMILLYFMHLKWDSKLFSLMFYIGLVLALGVYLVALFTFQFFS